MVWLTCWHRVNSPGTAGAHELSTLPTCDCRTPSAAQQRFQSQQPPHQRHPRLLDRSPRSGILARPPPALSLLVLLLLPTLLAPCAAVVHLRPELDLRQLQESIATTGFADSHVTDSNGFSTSSSSTRSLGGTGAGSSIGGAGADIIQAHTATTGAAHPGSQWELPGSPQELTDCINSHQPDSSGTAWSSAMRDEHSYFKVVGMWWSRKVADVPLTITTQLSWNRKWQLKAMCRSWRGPIAAVMHMPVLLPRLTKRKNAVMADVSNSTLQRAVDLVAAFHAKMDRLHPCKLDLMLLAEPYKDGKSLVLYPVNTMRNYARLMARTPLIGLVDVDLIVSSTLRKEMLDGAAAAKYVAQAEAAVAAAKAGRRGPEYSTGWSRRSGVSDVADMLNVTMRLNGPRTAYVLPAFATRGGSLAAQVERAEKLTSVTKDKLLPYYMRAQILRFDWGSTGHQNTNYNVWFNCTEPYLVEWSDRYEPWVFVDRLSSSWADSRFRGYGKNKIIQIRTLAYEGYELRVHPAAFLIHRAHVQSSSSTSHLRSSMFGHDRKRSTMYGHNIHLYNGVQRKMAHGKYIPEVDPATAVCRKKLSWWAGSPDR